MDNEQILVTRKEAARLISVSLRSLDYLILLGDLPTRRVGRRVLISRRALEQFARRDHPRLSRRSNSGLDGGLAEGTVETKGQRQ